MARKLWALWHVAGAHLVDLFQKHSLRMYARISVCTITSPYHITVLVIDSEPLHASGRAGGRKNTHAKFVYRRHVQRKVVYGRIRCCGCYVEVVRRVPRAVYRIVDYFPPSSVQRRGHGCGRHGISGAASPPRLAAHAWLTRSSNHACIRHACINLLTLHLLGRNQQ